MPPLPTAERLRLLETMLLIRRHDEALAAWAAPATPGTHTRAGREACAAGVVSALDGRDRLLTSQHGVGHLLARGADPGRLAAEVMGRASGYCGGRSGPLHLSVRELGVVLTSAIAGGGLAMAPGVALAQAMGAEGCAPGGITAVFFDDGAAGEGIVHEAWHLAAAWRLPLLFVCEHAPGPAPEPLADRVRGHGVVAAAAVGGHDVEAVRAQAQALVAAIRADGRPRLLELTAGPLHDPIDESVRRLRGEGVLDDAAWREMQDRVVQRVREALDHAQAQPWPTARALTDVTWA